MSDSPPTFDVWRHVYLVSEAISHGADVGSIDLTELEGHLIAIEEVFGDRVDPHEDFESFALIHLCRSIRRCLREDLRRTAEKY